MTRMTKDDVKEFYSVGNVDEVHTYSLGHSSSPEFGECSVCGEQVLLPFECPHCDRLYCVHHHLPWLITPYESADKVGYGHYCENLPTHGANKENDEEKFYFGARQKNRWAQGRDYSPDNIIRESNKHRLITPWRIILLAALAVIIIGIILI